MSLFWIIFIDIAIVLLAIAAVLPVTLEIDGVLDEIQDEDDPIVIL